MRFRKCVGTLALLSLSLTPLMACGGRSPGGFHPSGRAAPAGDDSPAGTAGATGGSATADPGDNGTQPQARTPQAALAAYRVYQAAYERAYSNSDASVLDGVAMDPLLTKIDQDVASVRASGVVWRFHNVLNPKIQGKSTDGSSVVILDCVLTLGAYRYSAKTGARLGSWRGGSHQYQAVMRYDAQIWKISDATRGPTC
jgi:hypothetical protein